MICCKLARISIEEEKLEVQQDPALHTEEKVIVDKIDIVLNFAGKYQFEQWYPKHVKKKK